LRLRLPQVRHPPRGIHPVAIASPLRAREVVLAKLVIGAKVIFPPENTTKPLTEVVDFLPIDWPPWAMEGNPLQPGIVRHQEPPR
jgi:hypothetical protein